MTTPIPQVTEDEFKRMSPQQIWEAHQTGRLKAIATGQDPTAPPPWPPGQVTEAELKTMEPRTIVDALEAGRLNALLGKPVAVPGQA